MSKKRKILWFCTAEFSDEKIKTTGTWLIAMGNALAKSEDFELYNVACGDVESITPRNSENIIQWIVPHEKIKKYNRGSKELIAFIQKIDSEINPDLIHLWGTENGFGFAVTEAKLQTPVLLDIQGLLFAYVQYYYGGLSNLDLFRCIGLKELLRPKNHPFFLRKLFKNKGKHELQLIKQMKNIAVQSDWVDSIIRHVNPTTSIKPTGIMLRSEFYETPNWEYPHADETINIFTSCSGPIPYKGFHVVFDAIALLKKKYPGIKLNIGGKIEVHKKYGVIRDGYTSFLLNKAKNLGITDSITWLGMMDADEMIKEMHRSTLVIVPSFVETYCLFMAESMMVGVPTVASYSSALPELAVHDHSALYFPPGDHWSCARQIERIIIDRTLALKLSTNARSIALERNDESKVLQKQLGIYKSILDISE